MHHTNSTQEQSFPKNSSENKKTRGDSIPALLSIDKAAKISGLGRNNLAYLIKYHKLPVVKLPGYNRIKIHYDDLINFIENNKCIFSNGLVVQESLQNNPSGNGNNHKGKKS